MNEDRRIGIFGYGSLVHETIRNNNDWGNGVETILGGWVREWRHCVDTPSGPICALSIRPQNGSKVQGVTALCDLSDLPSLDQREIGYKRIKLDAETLANSQNVHLIACFTFASKAPFHRAGGVDYPIWQSYLDCVMLGFLRRFGVDGIERFVLTTGGWDVPIMQDRDRPLYPRSVTLSKSERLCFDRLLEGCGVSYLSGEWQWDSRRVTAR